MAGAYLIVAWPEAAHERTAERLSQIDGGLREAGWAERARVEGLSVWTQGSTFPVRRLDGGGGVVIGDLFPRACAADPASPPGGDAAAQARRLSRNGWGRYVAVLRGRSDAAARVFRDPSGLVGALAWDLGDGVAVIASDVHSAPPGLAPRRLALNWDRIADFIVAPALGAMTPLFDDVVAVPPGGVLRTDALKAPAEFVWAPAHFAANDHRDLAAVAEALLAETDACVSALVSRFSPVVVELSGGLDSSVVAGAIGHTGQARHVAAWLNYQDARPEADESAFARAVTDRLGVPLTTPSGWAQPIDLRALQEIGDWSWPAIGGVDAGRDRDERARLRASGAKAIVSGQGGDGVFFQFPTPLVLADAWKRDGLRALVSPLPAAVARRTRTSVWAALAKARAALGDGYSPPRTPSTLVPRERAEAFGREVHPWVRHAVGAGLPPAKLLHIQGVAVTHLYGGPSRRLQEADMLLPLFAQPVLELALGVAAPDLASERYDRPFQRRVYAARLPPEIVARRIKGDMSTYFGKLVAASLDTLRPYLLDGCLADAGLLDRRMLDRTLDGQTLMAGGGGRAMDVLNAAAVEAWVRHWQGRVPDSPAAPRRR